LSIPVPAEPASSSEFRDRLRGANTNDVSSAIINGTEPTISQGEIDSLLQE